MAKSKHRKEHKKALANYRMILAAAEMVKEQNQPVEVGKSRFQVDPEDTQPATVMVDGVEVPAHLVNGGIQLETAPKKGSKVQVGYAYPSVKSNKLRGYRDVLSDMAFFRPGEVCSICGDDWPCTEHEVTYVGMDVGFGNDKTPPTQGLIVDEIEKFNPPVEG